jgi:hypothetical protein
MLVVAAVAALPLLQGCDAILGRELNPAYCQAHTDDVDCRRAFPDAAPDGPTMCTGNAQCTAPTGVCDLETGGSMTCVQCTTSDAEACTGATPACVDHLCQKCTAHTQCTASNVCLPDGTCADAAQVAYVQAGGTGALPCTKAAPCSTLDAGVRANKPTVKVAAGMVADNKVTIVDARTLTIVADPGAKLTRSNNGVILQVQNTGADVTIYDLDITAGSGASNPAISIPNGGDPKLRLIRVTVDGNQGPGISATAGTLTVAQSSIHDNSGGGLSISGALFDITNSFVTRNGSAGTTFGGVSINSIPVGSNVRFEFNTVAGNVAAGTINSGVDCSSVLAPVSLSDSIIYGNITSGGGRQVGGSANCVPTYCDIGPDAFAGTGNIASDPQFVSATQPDYHLQSSSPARNAANPGATITVDFEGDVRPQGGRSDIGADEVRQ